MRRRKFLTRFQSSLLHQKRALAEEIHKKQEQDWLCHIGIGDQTIVVHDNDEPDDGPIPMHNEDNVKKSLAFKFGKNAPSSKVLEGTIVIVGGAV
ncbi:hypothetical protein Tco_0215384 [Tanacetum coccineum]